VQQLCVFEGASIPPGHVRQLHQELLLFTLRAGLPGNGAGQMDLVFIFTLLVTKWYINILLGLNDFKKKLKLRFFW
jgi:hypothetical protein